MRMDGLSRILIIDDDNAINTALSIALRDGYKTDRALNGKDGLELAGSNNYSAVILDLNLPDFDGLAICQELRDRGCKAPIFIISGEDQVLTKIKLFDAGANDYLTKPFSLGELKARLRAMIRTSQHQLPKKRRLSASGLILNRETRSVQREGMVIKLRKKEFEILECLMENAGTIVSRSSITRYAWNGGDDPWTNTVDVHIKYLRDKIDKPFAEQLIETVHGMGYRLIKKDENKAVLGD